jgi:FAD/FMN-containing dehydrogenase
VSCSAAAIFATPEEEPGHTAWPTEYAGELRQGDTGAYVNFVADEGEERVHAAYPGETWDRLAEVKRVYDPTNLFRLNQNIPPAPN